MFYHYLQCNFHSVVCRFFLLSILFAVFSLAVARPSLFNIRNTQNEHKFYADSGCSLRPTYFSLSLSLSVPLPLSQVRNQITSNCSWHTKVFAAAVHTQRTRYTSIRAHTNSQIYTISNAIKYTQAENTHEACTRRRWLWDARHRWKKSAALSPRTFQTYGYITTHTGTFWTVYPLFVCIIVDRCVCVSLFASTGWLSFPIPLFYSICVCAKCANENCVHDT